MIFGSTDTFAIEAIIEPDLEAPSAVWGRMRIWCQGVSIGDISTSCCALYPSYLGFRDLLGALPSLWCPAFTKLSDIQLWNRLDGLLYGYHGDEPVEDERSLEQLEQDHQNYRKFDFLTNWGEQFDQGGKSFIVCTPAQQVRILNRHFPEGYGLGLHASLFQVASAIKNFMHWFEHEARRLGHPVPGI